MCMHMFRPRLSIAWNTLSTYVFWVYSIGLPFGYLIDIYKLDPIAGEIFLSISLRKIKTIGTLESFLWFSVSRTYPVDLYKYACTFCSMPNSGVLKKQRRFYKLCPSDSSRNSDWAIFPPVLMDRVESFAWHEYVQTVITTRQSHANIGTNISL